jgi:hypothetical protein
MRLLTRLRLWRCQRSGFQGITPLNTVDEWDGATGDTLAFHYWIKKPLMLAVRANRVPDSWLAQLEGNPAVLWSIIEKVYLQNEGQAHRRAILEPILRFGICLVSFDNNYREVFNSVLAGIIRERGLFTFDASETNPDNWFRDDRGRIELSLSAPFRVLSRTPDALLLDARIDGPVIQAVEQATGKSQYIALDLEHCTEPYPGLYHYPIAAVGTSVLDVAPQVIAGAA